MAKTYRYRDNSQGVTRISLQSMHHLDKIGKIRYIRGVTWINEHDVLTHGVIVRGSKGYVRFGGFLWGYHGEGPRGLLY